MDEVEVDLQQDVPLELVDLHLGPRGELAQRRRVDFLVLGRDEEARDQHALQGAPGHLHRRREHRVVQVRAQVQRVLRRPQIVEQVNQVPDLPNVTYIPLLRAFGSRSCNSGWPLCSPTPADI